MTTLRFRYRHVHATMFDFVRTSLVGLDWGNRALPDNNIVNSAVNFGTVPATYIDFQPEEAGAAIVTNTVAVTLGDEPASVDKELGAGLREIAFPVFIDIYGANQAIAQSIASDVKDALEDIYLSVMDYTVTPVVPTDDQIELDKDDLLVEKPQASLNASDIKRHWRVVKTFARVQYIGGAE